MENAIYIGLSRQVALQRQLSVAANNIANANTPGYKAQRMLFVQHLAEAGSAGPGRPSEISMVIDRAVVRDSRTGAMEHTGNPLDVAIQGAGYMVVETEAGPRYTRAGRLAIDSEGRLVDTNRLPLLGDDDRPLAIPPGGRGLAIAADGTVSTAQGIAGRLKLVRFENEAGLTALGGGLLASNEVPLAAEGIEIAQGMLEGSNVQPILEMTRLIEISRQFEATQRLLQSEHGRQREAIGRLAGTSQN